MEFEEYTDPQTNRIHVQPKGFVPVVSARQQEIMRLASSIRLLNNALTPEGIAMRESLVCRLALVRDSLEYPIA